MILRPFRLRPALLLASALAAGPLAAAERYADRPDVQQFIAEMKERHGFDPDALTFIFRRATFQPAVIKAISPPKDPGVRSWQRYRGRFIEPVRIKAGVRFWDAYAETIKAASDKYGVPEEIIVGIIGVETIYGRNTGSFQAVSALSTLAFDYPRRAELFRGELESLLLMAREQGRDPLDYQGSYAGALGLPQFLPSSVRNYAVDFDGDGHIDLLASPKDAIGSVARYLQMHGWERGGPVAIRAVTNADATLETLIANDITPAFDAEALAAHGVHAASGTPAVGPAAFVQLVTPGADSEYWLGYQNFYVITRYNRSSFYAMSVFQLAEAVKEARQARR
ncbi:MAG TPA: lytic murein transglycosylase B [Rhodocyclaceae bacterium]|nr:lytic murein transglycosylase B [Rhodocyclaceae bacterium]HMW50987.1 lytic murein transglycosylase B [Rhodocyclaceae bacterium]HMY49123.1 lytic murein transglycosylase B [Rhodocyclaceae bacterium]HMZ75636.1 lytic murein transglycosylase B [Rhodocyclaceae bacterium]HNI80491.1 lytic murein transglycosylase B [Rhodocyclaceae bacterium]